MSVKKCFPKLIKPTLYIRLEAALSSLTSIDRYWPKERPEAMLIEVVNTVDSIETIIDY